MPSSILVVSPLARADLRNIYEYGVNNWGTTQASNYLDNIKEHFWRLTEHPKIGLDRIELFPGIRSCPVDRHILFYRIQNSQLEIIRILHARQDPFRHI